MGWIGSVLGLAFIVWIIYGIFAGGGGGDIDGRDPGPPGSW
jgi:hypothetical protein